MEKPAEAAAAEGETANNSDNMICMGWGKRFPAPACLWSEHQLVSDRRGWWVRELYFAPRAVAGAEAPRADKMLGEQQQRMRRSVSGIGWSAAKTRRASRNNDELQEAQ